MEFINLKNNYHQLLSYLEDNSYSSSYISRMKACIDWILDHDNDAWTSYCDVLEARIATCSSQSPIVHKVIKAIISAIYRFDLYNEFPSRSRNTTHKLLPTSATDKLNPCYRAIISRFIEASKIRGLKASTIDSISGNTASFLLSMEFLNAGEPVISIDTKKKENIGNFKNNGAEYRPVGGERKVLDHDFPLLELGKVAPYRVYVLNNNTGFVNLGTSHDTPEFAGVSVAQWWRHIGKETFPNATKLYITCDSGGSNGCRIWLFKYYVQQLANETGLEIHVSHFPTGTSKWNKVEHRLFCYISKNWQGQPLIDVETVIELISSTTTEKGLTVK